MTFVSGDRPAAARSSYRLVSSTSRSIRSLATRVPAPRLRTTRPLLDRYWKAARTVGRDRPSRSASCTSLSSREPTLSAPDLIAASKCWASWKYSGTGLVRSIVITLGAATLPAAVWGSCIRLVIQFRRRCGTRRAGPEGSSRYRGLFVRTLY